MIARSACSAMPNGVAGSRTSIDQLSMLCNETMLTSLSRLESKTKVGAGHKSNRAGPSLLYHESHRSTEP